MKRYKTLLIALGATVLAAAFGVGFHYAFNVATGRDPATVAFDDLQTALVAAREDFLLQSDAYQTVCMYVNAQTGVSVLRAKDGQPHIESDVPSGIFGDNVTSDEPNKMLAELFKFDGADNKADVLNLYVDGSGVYFYTAYTQNYTCGVVWTRFEGAIENWETMELMDEWKLFFKEH